MNREGWPYLFFEETGKREVYSSRQHWQQHEDLTTVMDSNFGTWDYANFCFDWSNTTLEAGRGGLKLSAGLEHFTAFDEASGHTGQDAFVSHSRFDG
jgi:hypothetical protein